MSAKRSKSRESLDHEMICCVIFYPSFILPVSLTFPPLAHIISFLLNIPEEWPPGGELTRTEVCGEGEEFHPVILLVKGKN